MKKFIDTTISFIVVVQLTCAAQQNVTLVTQQQLPVMIYKNELALIRFTYTDVIKELKQLKKSDWYLSLDTDSQERFDDVLSEQERDYKIALKNQSIKHLDPSAPVQYEPLFMLCIQKFLGASLLAKGKAAVWKREPLMAIPEIQIQYAPDRSNDRTSFFHFPDDPNFFFSGIIVENLASVADLGMLNLEVTKNDSLARTINAEAKRVLSQAPPGLEKGIEALGENLRRYFTCRPPERNKTIRIQLTFDSKGFVDVNSIEILDAEFTLECQQELKDIVLKTKQLKPAGSTIGEADEAFQLVLPMKFN